MNIDERVNYYLGPNFPGDDINDAWLNTKDYTDAAMLREKLVAKHPRKKKRLDRLFNIISRRGHSDKKFFWSCIEIQHILPPYYLTKNRHLFSSDGVLVKSVTQHRHWYHYYNKPEDVAFARKKDMLFWRGGPTGCGHHARKHAIERSANRFNLLRSWTDVDKSIDIGLSRHPKRSRHELFYDDAVDVQRYVKTPVSIEEFLQHKYILSVEGNDKDSGINWKLNSNSVVFMPKPRVTSWLMEPTLIPDHHYVLIKDDFSDLKDRIDWCNSNPVRCQEIIANANAYMNQFSNIRLEEEIEGLVIDEYFRVLDQYQL